MAQTPGIVDVATNYTGGKPELRLLADPARVGDLGLTNADIASSVRALINGERATVLRQDGKDTDIVVRLATEDRQNPAALGDIVIPTRSGSVTLSSLGKFELASSPVSIRRYDRLSQIIVGANLQELNTADAQKQITDFMNAQNLPADIVWSFTGVVQQQSEGFTSLIIAMLLSVLFVYMVLASQFGSFTQPLVIMLAMPFSFIGAFIGLLLTNTDLDITGMIGLILLLGLVTKNSILLVDFTNKLRAAGMEKHEALRVAGSVRLRPILMTTFAIVAGALPVAMGIHIIGTGQGSEFRRGLATVLIGGLTTSMVLTLFVVPAAYSLLDSLATRLSRKPTEE
jgi:HAE1 family hydrophobic/amphiphilic exporter-1